MNTYSIITNIDGTINCRCESYNGYSCKKTSEYRIDECVVNHDFCQINLDQWNSYKSLISNPLKWSSMNLQSSDERYSYIAKLILNNQLTI